MSEPNGWARSEEYVKETIKRLDEGLVAVREDCRKNQIDLEVMKARGYFWNGVVTSIIAAIIVIILKYVWK